MGNHRADRSARTATSRSVVPARSAARGSADRPAGGRRKATRAARPARGVLRAPAGAFAPSFPRLAALPTLIGAAALVTAAGGALALGQGITPDSRLALSAGAAHFNGSDVDVDLSARDQAISRDAQRQALHAATKADLQAAAEAQSDQRSAALASLAKEAEHRGHEIAAHLWTLPTSGYHLTARFGQSSGLWASVHTGLDFAGPVGDPLVAVADGTITSTGYDGAYGNKTVLTLDDGTEIWYCHQDAITVSVGERVHQGEQIGLLGNTGNTTGPHLHLEVRPGGGDPIDPYYALIQHGVTP